MLTTLAAGPVGVFTDVLIPIDLDPDVLALRLNVNRRKARFALALGAERGDADKAMHTRLARKVPVRVRPPNLQTAGLNARLLPITHGKFIDLVVVSLEVS